MRKQGYNAGFSRWDGGWQNLITEDRVPGDVPFEEGETYVFQIVITDGHIIDYYIDDTAILRDFDLTKKSVRDVMVISSDIAAVNYVLENTKGVRGVYDVSATTKTYTEDELLALMQTPLTPFLWTNTMFAK